MSEDLIQADCGEIPSVQNCCCCCSPDCWSCAVAADCGEIPSVLISQFQFHKVVHYHSLINLFSYAVRLFS
ncbi:hypothetical protein RHGRI_023980 [Rhododendron griersonianum]|uniref:Uncharacterized protein n=1 Tax=Rhododendron griersonianum TaxID=479676 RepID=A0AAV6JCW0_9ERIC|nr:hypothetical protein RHGRI_023980 [Rhododendron griersonianum]